MYCSWDRFVDQVMSVEYISSETPFCPRSRYCNLDNLPSWGGIRPANGMPERLRYLKLYMKPKNSGKVLFGLTKQFMLRSKCRRCLSESKEGLIWPNKALVSAHPCPLLELGLGLRRRRSRTWPLWLLHLMPLHRQQSSPCQEARLLPGSKVMLLLNESKAALSSGMQLPPATRYELELLMFMMMRRKKMGRSNWLFVGFMLWNSNRALATKAYQNLKLWVIYEQTFSFSFPLWRYVWPIAIWYTVYDSWDHRVKVFVHKEK